jgi:hypothetical protein
MSEVVICDTNVAIHLAIVCPAVLKTPNPKCKIVIHTIVKQEIHQLNLDVDKRARLGEILDFILKEVITDTKLGFPPKDKEIRQHQMIQKFESGLDPQLLSSGSSHQDRRFLILAKTHKAKLLTNEKTLYSLGVAFLPQGQTWRTSNALEQLLAQNILNKNDVQVGLNKLPTFKERLHPDCIDRLHSLGFTC